MLRRRNEGIEHPIDPNWLLEVRCVHTGDVVRQFARWITTHSFTSYDGSFDYQVPLSTVRQPFLLLAGSRDLLAPPLAVARAKEHLGGPVKLVVAGRAHGFAEDYGHADLVLGRRAPDEIFPLVETFLSAHATCV